MTNKPHREQCLDRAKALTLGDRNKQYGDPYTNLKNHADMFTVFCKARGLLAPDKAFIASDMAECLNLGKIARRAQNVQHVDSYDDGVAYTAIAHECVIAEQDWGLNADADPYEELERIGDGN
jgi:hypothetical protein